MNIIITVQALYFALAVGTVLAFWLAWHHDRKKIAVCWVLLSILSLIFAIGESGTIQLIFGCAIVLIFYGLYRWYRDTREDSAEKPATSGTKVKR